MWQVLRTPRLFCGISGVIVLKTSLSSVRLSRLFVCDGSWAHWGSAGGGTGVLTVELSQRESPRSTSAPNQSIHSSRGNPRHHWKGASEWLLSEVPFWSLRGGGFWRAACPLCRWCQWLSCGWLTGWGVTNDYNVCGPCPDGRDNGASTCTSL